MFFPWFDRLTATLVVNNVPFQLAMLAPHS